jgi:hypothetical protein
LPSHADASLLAHDPWLVRLAAAAAVVVVDRRGVRNNGPGIFFWAIGACLFRRTKKKKEKTEKEEPATNSFDQAPCRVFSFLFNLLESHNLPPIPTDRTTIHNTPKPPIFTSCTS